ncbi:MAG: amidohydrolase family protein [Selenomonadales bacterium]|nr:amidohydrolase family protein [Selenomonadales bacterium]
MIIDFHTHSFPEEIAARAIAKLSGPSHMDPYTDGTRSGLLQSMKEGGIGLSVLMPVATSPRQTTSINRIAIETNEQSDKTGLASFGAVHPDNADYRIQLRTLAENGIKGIKLHPVFHQIYFDDIRYMRIVDCAAENNLAVTIHGGYDIGFPGQDFVTPEHILPVIKEVGHKKLIAAHMGGWSCWNDAEQLLACTDIYLDTSFSLMELYYHSGKRIEHLSNEKFCCFVRHHGADKILFGSDSPWVSQKASVEAIRESGLNENEVKLILEDNAKALLK